MTINATTIDKVPDMTDTITGEENILVQASAGSSATRKTSLNNLKTLFGTTTDPGDKTPTVDYNPINYFTKGDYAKSVELKKFSKIDKYNYTTPEYIPKQDENLYIHLLGIIKPEEPLKADAYMSMEIQMRTNDTGDKQWVEICKIPLVNTPAAETVKTIDMHMHLQADLAIRGHVFLGNVYGAAETVVVKDGSGFSGVAISEKQFSENNYTKYLYINSSNEKISFSPIGDKPYALEVYLCGYSSKAQNVNVKISKDGGVNWTQTGKQISTSTDANKKHDNMIGKFSFSKSETATIGFTTPNSNVTKPLYFKINFCTDIGTLKTPDEIKATTINSLSSMILKSNKITTFKNVTKNDTSNEIVDICIKNDFSDIKEIYAQYNKDYLEELVSSGEKTMYVSDEIGSISFHTTGTENYPKDTELTYVRLNHTAKEIGENCFYDCQALSVVELSDSSIETVNPNAFYNTINLSSLNFPNTLKTLKSQALRQIPKLTSLYIPSKIQEIPSNVLDGTPLIITNKGKLYIKLSKVPEEGKHTDAKSEIENNSVLSNLYKISNLKKVTSATVVFAEVVKPNGEIFIFKNGSNDQKYVVQVGADTINCVEKDPGYNPWG